MYTLERGQLYRFTKYDYFTDPTQEIEIATVGGGYVTAILYEQTPAEKRHEVGPMRVPISWLLYVFEDHGAELVTEPVYVPCG